MVPHVLRALQPQVLVTQHGCDSHRHDPLADLDLSLDGQRASYLALAALADELCEGRWVSTGGGGYAVLHVVPRAWTHLLGIVSGEPVPPQTPVPEAWRAEMGEGAPRTMTDGVDVSFEPFERGVHPGEPAGSGHHGHPAGGVPRARARPRALSAGSAAYFRRERPSSTSCGVSQNKLCICCTSSTFYHYSHSSTAAP